MPGKIFINYRRDDSIGTAGRLHDRLVQAFGRKNVFMDVDQIPAGVDFVRHLHAQVAECDVFLAVIGPSWLDTKDGSGGRKLDNPEDFVRVELLAALGRDVRVIPVLVDGAEMPRPDQLPEPLRPLSRRNAVEVRNVQFGSDAERLIGKVGEALRGERPGVPIRWPVAALAAAVLLVAGTVALNQLGPEWPWGRNDDAKAADETKRAEAEKARKAEAEAKRVEAERARKAEADAEAKRVADAAKTKKDAEDKRLADAAEANRREGDKTRPKEALGRYEIIITNQTGMPILIFQYRDCGADWGGDRLGTKEVIHNRDKRIFNMHDGNPDCCRDMRATLENEDKREKRVDVCRTNEWVVR